MSWLSELTNIHISAPPAIQQLGDNLLHLGAQAVPGAGGFLDSVLVGHGSQTTAQIAQQTQANLAAQGQAAYGAASYVASQQSGGYASLVNNPLLIVGVAIVVVLAMRRR